MSISGTQHEQIQTALLAAFDEAGLRQMVKFELDADLDIIADGRDLEERTFNPVAWADRRGQAADLLRGANNQNPDNSQLSSLVRNACEWPDLARFGLTLIDGKTHTFAPRHVEGSYHADLVQSFQVWSENYIPLRGVAEMQQAVRDELLLVLA